MERPLEGAILVSGQVDTWLENWNMDDVDAVLSACADDFVYDDPYDGRMGKEEFAEYFRAFPDGDWLGSDYAMQEADGQEIHWFWWAWKPKGASEWTIEGCSLTKAGPDGIHSSRQAYYKGAGFRAAAKAA